MTQKKFLINIQIIFPKRHLDEMPFVIYNIHMPQDKIIQTEILLQSLSLKLSQIRSGNNKSEVERLVQLRRDVYSGKISDPLLEISKLN